MVMNCFCSDAFSVVFYSSISGANSADVWATHFASHHQNLGRFLVYRESWKTKHDELLSWAYSIVMKYFHQTHLIYCQIHLEYFICLPYILLQPYKPRKCIHINTGWSHNFQNKIISKNTILGREWISSASLASILLNFNEIMILSAEQENGAKMCDSHSVSDWRNESELLLPKQLRRHWLRYLNAMSNFYQTEHFKCHIHIHMVLHLTSLLFAQTPTQNCFWLIVVNSWQ